MTRETRKIQKVGGSTYSVSLPKSWARARDLEAGSQVTVVAHPDDALVVEPGDGDEAVERTVTVEHDDPERLEALVRAAYAAGLDTLRIEATETLTRSQRRAVGRTTEALPGTAVVEERETRMVVRVLLDGEEVSIAQSVRQLAFVAAAMHREALAALTGEAAPDAVDRDAEPDRLFALVDRHFQRGLSRVVTLDSLDAARPELAELRATARALRAVAADARRLGDLAAELEPVPASASTREDGADAVAFGADSADSCADLSELGERACEVVELATDAVAGDADVDAAVAALARRADLREELASVERGLLADDGPYWQGRALEHCRRTTDRGAEIARLALRGGLRRGELDTIPAGIDADDPGTLREAASDVAGQGDATGPDDATGPSDAPDPVAGEPAEGAAEAEPPDVAPDADS